MKRLILIALVAPMCGCVAKLAEPTLDHAAQLRRVVNDCAEHREVLDVPAEDASHACTVELLELQAKKAECLHAISTFEECSEP